MGMIWEKMWQCEHTGLYPPSVVRTTQRRTKGTAVSSWDFSGGFLHLVSPSGNFYLESEQMKLCLSYVFGFMLF